MILTDEQRGDIDNKPGVQALDRTQPSRPANSGHVATSTHDYVRKGTVDLFAAFNTRTGWVSAGCFDRHRTVDFLDFMDEVAEEYKDAPEVHVVLDNASIHSGEEVDDWLGEHPNFVFHYTPAGGSWLNQVENWFGILSRKALERGVFASVADSSGPSTASSTTGTSTPCRSSGMPRQARSSPRWSNSTGISGASSPTIPDKVRFRRVP